MASSPLSGQDTPLRDVKSYSSNIAEVTQLTKSLRFTGRKLKRYREKSDKNQNQQEEPQVTLKTAILMNKITF